MTWQLVLAVLAAFVARTSGQTFNLWDEDVFNAFAGEGSTETLQALDPKDHPHTDHSPISNIHKDLRGDVVVQDAPLYYYVLTYSDTSCTTQTKVPVAYLANYCTPMNNTNGLYYSSYMWKYIASSTPNAGYIKIYYYTDRQCQNFGTTGVQLWTGVMNTCSSGSKVQTASAAEMHSSTPGSWIGIFDTSSHCSSLNLPILYQWYASTWYVPFSCTANTVSNSWYLIYATKTVIVVGGPTPMPTFGGTPIPTPTPSVKPTHNPSASPSTIPTPIPTARPTHDPTAKPSVIPTAEPTAVPSTNPTAVPSVVPTSLPTANPSPNPTAVPTAKPSVPPTAAPTVMPSTPPTTAPTVAPTTPPTTGPTTAPTTAPTPNPSKRPTRKPTIAPTADPTESRNTITVPVGIGVGVGIGGLALLCGAAYGVMYVVKDKKDKSKDQEMVKAYKQTPGLDEGGYTGVPGAGETSI